MPILKSNNAMKKFIAVVCIQISLIVAAFAQDVTLSGVTTCASSTTSTPGTWTVPCGVTSITIEVYGAGGGGGGSADGSNGGVFCGNNRGGGGGAGGGYTSITINVTPGTTFNYTIGSGGCGGRGRGEGSSGDHGINGGNSTFVGIDAGGTAINLTANGGQGGRRGNSCGSVGGTSNGGTATGGTTNLTGTNGSGAGAAGSYIGGAGGAGAGPLGGAGGSAGNNSNGGPGLIYGGGSGGGAGDDRGGGSGAAGGILITYNGTVTLPTTPTINTTPPTCTSAGSSVISNYNASVTYVFTPAGPTVAAGGAINGMVTGTSYTVVARENGCDSAPSAAFSNGAQTAPPATPTITTAPASCTSSGSSTITNYNASLTYIFSPTGPTAGAGGVISGTTAGTNYTVIASDGNCDSPPSTAFSNDAQLTRPTAAISGNLTYCTGGNTTLTASGGVGYAWFNLSGNNIGNSASVTVTQGSYAVLVTAANGCADTATATVTELTSLTVNISGALNYCPGGNTTLTASGGNSYIWNDANNSTAASITVTAGNYSVTGTDANGCTGSASVVVTQNTPPTINISGTLSYCEGSNTTLTASGASNYVWDDANNSTNTSITVTQGNYTVTGTDANGCSATASATVSENALPAISISGLLNYCVGGNTTLTATGGSTYLWNTGDATASITVTQGNYEVTATDGNGCIGNASATVTETSSLVVNIDGNLTFCSGTATTLNATGGTSYTWGNGINDPNITITQAGVYSVTASDASCTGTASVTVSEIQATPVNLGNDIIVCENLAVTIDAGGGYVSYTWNNGEDTQTLSPDASGNYAVTVVDANGCSASSSVNVTFGSFPVVQLGNDTTVNKGGSVNISPVITPTPTGSVTYLWQSEGDGLLSCTNCASPTITVQDTTVVTLTYTNEFGCSAQDNFTIFTIPALPIFIPNAFSPNRDGENDVFQIYGGGFKEFYLTIHNRWGQKVFESNDNTQVWDGTFKGKEQEQGVYVYYVKFVSTDLVIQTLTGSVTLLR